MKIFGAALIVTLLGLTFDARATTFFPQAFTCPVGGEKFKANVIASMTSWGRRPDGKLYGTTPIVPLTECPKNGFLYFQSKFEKAEIDKLAPLVLGAEFQKMRISETPYYRAWWLLCRMGSDGFEQASILLVASWEADSDPDRKRRYQALLVEKTEKLSWSEERRSDWFWLNLRAANALRELNQFGRSSQLLADIDTEERLPIDREELAGARYLIDGLKVLNAESNPAVEPANLIPPMEAARRCETGADQLTPVEVSVCNSTKVRESIETLRKYKSKTD